MTVVQIQRDPFARADLMRDTLAQHGRGPCLWCGQPGRFIYGWDQDRINVRPVAWSGPFCSVDCYRTYHG